MNFKKIVSFFALCMCFSCGTSLLTINSASKKINYPGIPTAKEYLKYTVEFASNEEFTIQSVKINNIDAITKFGLFSLEKEKSISTNLTNDKGKYELTFKTFDVSKIDVNEEVFISILSEGKTTTQKINIQKKEALRGK